MFTIKFDKILNTHILSPNIVEADADVKKPKRSMFMNIRGP